MANTTFYNRGDAYHDSAGNPAIIKRGNELTFTEHFNAGGGGSSAPDFSTTEHATGRKWIDGKDIYEKTIHASNVTLAITSVIDATIKSNTVSTIISLIGTIKDNEGSVYECYVSSNDRVVPVVNTNGVTLLISNVTVTDYDITIQYTKVTPTRTSKKKG